MVLVTNAKTTRENDDDDDDGSQSTQNRSGDQKVITVTSSANRGCIWCIRLVGEVRTILIDSPQCMC